MTILFAVEAEGSLLGSSGASGLSLIFLIRGVWIELPEAVLFVGPLFLGSHGSDGRFVLFVGGRLYFTGGGDSGDGGFGLGLEVTIPVELDSIRDLRDGEV